MNSSSSRVPLDRPWAALFATFRPHRVKALALGLGLTLAPMSSQRVHAATYYWDENAALAGFGTAGTNATNWSSSTSLFTTSSGGTVAPTGTQATLIGDVTNFGTASLGLGAGTITVSGPITATSITFGSANGALTLSGGTITLNASIVNNVNNTLRPQTINSDIDLNGVTHTFRSVGTASIMTIGGNLSNGTAVGTTAISIDATNATNAGIVTLAGINSFTGDIQIATSSGAGILRVSSIGNQASLTSNLGAGAKTIKMGASGRDGTLIYIGTGETTNRPFTNASSDPASDAIIDQSGTGLLTLSGGFANSGTSGKTLTFQGSTLGTGEFSGAITDGAGSQLNLTKAGTNTWTLSGTNTYRSSTTVSGGTLKGTQNTGTPFGTGAVTITNSTLALAPSGSGGTPGFTGGTIAANTNFTYGSGATLSLDKGAQTRMTYTYGSASAGTAFARGTNGTLIISATSMSSLGDGSTGERFIINAGSTAPTQVNGIVVAVVGRDRSASDAGDFLTYGATNGFAKATYTKTNDLTTSSDTDIVEITSDTNSAVASAAYALKLGAATVTNSGNTITLGNTTSGAVAGLILNGGTISNGILTTNATSAEYAVYVGTAGGTISSAITHPGTTPAGMSVFGPGVLNLSGSAGNSFTGDLRVNSSTVIVNNDNQLGDASGQINLNGSTLQTSGTVALGTSGQRNIVLGIGDANSGGTFNVVSGTTTFTSAASKVISGTSLTKTGSGSLVLAGATPNTYTGPTTVKGGTLEIAGSINAGSQVSVSSGTLLLSANNAVNTSTPLTLGSSADSTNGKVQFGDSLNNASATFGSLTLSFASTLDFGAGTGGQDFVFSSFSSSSHASGGPKLTIDNWTGSGGVLGNSTTDRLIFTGKAADFNAAFGPGDVEFTGFGSGYQAISFNNDTQFEVVAVPEPSSTALIGCVGLVGFILLRNRRRDYSPS